MQKCDSPYFKSVLEPGTPTGFRWIHEIRELFITVLGSGKFHFVAPVSLSVIDVIRSGLLILFPSVSKRIYLPFGTITY